MGGDACVALRPQTKVDLRRPEESSGRGEGGWVDVVWAFMVARGEGHLASPMVGYYVVGQSVGHAGRRKRPHSTQHHSRPYADNERKMAWHGVAQKINLCKRGLPHPFEVSTSHVVHSYTS